MIMKRRLLVLCSLMLVLFVGCGSTATSDNEQGTEVQQTETQETEHTHSYVEEITTEATCEVDGVKMFTCECGDSYTEVITATGHNYEEVADSAVTATCAKDGKEVDTKCTICGNVIEGEAIPSLAHSYGEYVYNNDATTSADGTETATCSVCGGTTTRAKAGTMIVEYPEFPYELYTAWYDGTYFYFYHDQTHGGYAAGYESIYALAQSMQDELFEKFPDGYGFAPQTETATVVGQYKNTGTYCNPSSPYMNVVLITTYPVSSEEWDNYMQNLPW